MKDSGAETNKAVQSGASTQLPAISEHKLKANRENAKKSTGPKTLRGKAYSRRNALKHGLFALDLFPNFLSRTENQQEYRELRQQLWQYYQPVGAAEEFEVDRVCQCMWRQKRAWRYENAQLWPALVEVADTGRRLDRVFCSEYGTLLPRLLKNAVAEIRASGHISDDLREQICGMDPSFREIWISLENTVEHNKGLARREAMALLAGSTLPDSLRESAATIATAAVTNLAINYLEHRGQQNIQLVADVARDHHLIPESEVVDKIVRYETAIDRALNRSQDRLERLQRRRKGEPTLPPVSVRLTQ